MSKSRIFWPLAALLVLADCTTKELAVDRLSPSYTSHEVFGSLLQFTLVYNPGTAFGFDLQPYFGAWTRPVLIAAMTAILVFLALLYRRAGRSELVAATALALVCGGAVGNLLDRLRFTRGGVDFIDVGIGPHRFWVFNVADAGITVGALLLALILARDDRTELFHG
jgi:signal peptidase II